VHDNVVVLGEVVSEEALMRAMVYRGPYKVRVRCRSEPQIAANVTRTIASPGCSIAGMSFYTTT
jgi:hypothetical protein